MLNTHGMVVVASLVMDKGNRVRFFEKTFLVANISLEVVYGMLFLTLSGVDIDFSGREIRWKTDTIEEALPPTKHAELVDKKEFAAVALDSEHEIYIIYIGLVSFHALPSSDTSPNSNMLLNSNTSPSSDTSPSFNTLLSSYTSPSSSSLDVHPFRKP